jgi:hypothetical protein
MGARVLTGTGLYILTRINGSNAEEITLIVTPDRAVTPRTRLALKTHELGLL